VRSPPCGTVLKKSEEKLTRPKQATAELSVAEVSRRRQMLREALVESLPSEEKLPEWQKANLPLLSVRTRRDEISLRNQLDGVAHWKRVRFKAPL